MKMKQWHIFFFLESSTISSRSSFSTNEKFTFSTVTLNYQENDNSSSSQDQEISTTKGLEERSSSSSGSMYDVMQYNRLSLFNSIT